VNGAAVFDMAPIIEITESSFDWLFAINVKGLLFTGQAVARLEGETSNSLLETSEGWNIRLKGVKSDLQKPAL
jgi:NAD(P)-dependent dehydrogenase (short-subunit alcohol dehydrogenase family)